jgi:hypothetical protein
MCLVNWLDAQIVSPSAKSSSFLTTYNLNEDHQTLSKGVQAHMNILQGILLIFSKLSVSFSLCILDRVIFLTSRDHFA